ncbi:MAG TPA: hypothetical protein VF168_12385 [Trueperaceae bacterium]
MLRLLDVCRALAIFAERWLLLRLMPCERGGVRRRTKVEVDVLGVRQEAVEIIGVIQVAQLVLNRVGGAVHLDQVGFGESTFFLVFWAENVEGGGE